MSLLRLGRCGIALAFACSALALGLAVPSPAGALFTRPFIRSIDIPSAEPLTRPFEEADGVAVDSANNLYVLDSAFGPVASARTVIDKFDPAGKLISEFTGEGNFQLGFETRSSALAVQGTSGDMYVLGLPFGNSFDAGSVASFAPTGAFLNGWTVDGASTGVAVDNSTDPTDPNSGDVLVAEDTTEELRLFTPSGTPVNFTGTASYISGNAITGTPGGSFGFETPWAVATDAQGDIYLTGRTGGLLEYSPRGLLLRGIPGVGSGWGVAIDPTNGHILVSEGGGVHELDSSGNSLNFIGSAPPTGSGPAGSTSSTAVDSEGNLYVAARTEENGVFKTSVEEFGPGAFLPQVVVSGATDRQPESAMLNGEVDPEGVALTDCHFEYVSQAAFEAAGFSNLGSGGEAPCVPSAASIPVDSSFHAVHADVSGLHPGVSYHFRLVATSDPKALGGTAASAPVAFTAPAGPSIDGTSAANVSSSFAQISARIDPHGADTTYQFEYIGAAGYEAAVNAGAADPYSGGGVVPANPADIGAGGSDVSVMQGIGGLAPDTEYHFRVLATSALGAVAGTDATFVTLPAGSSLLPDGRADELVTPADKGDSEDMFGFLGTLGAGGRDYDVGIASEDGDHFLLDTVSAFGPSPGAGENTYVFSRGATGWSYRSVVASALGSQSDATEVFDPVDLSQVGVRAIAGSGFSPPTFDVVGPPGGPYSTVETGQDNTVSEAEIEGASADLGHVVLETEDHALTPGDSTQDPGSEALYDASGGQLALVNVNDEGSPVSRCGAVLGGGKVTSGTRHNAVSRDGSKIFFTAPDPYSTGFHCRNEGFAPELYVREKGERTVEVSAPQPGVHDPDGTQAALFVGAANDGSKVFFLSNAELTQDDEHIHDLELYEYDTVAQALTRVSRGASGDAEGKVAFVPAISADGSTVYFVSESALAPGAPENGEANLYHYDTNTGETVFVANGPEEYLDTSLGNWFNGKEVSGDTGANWYTTGNGDYLAFASKADLTGYDTAAGAGGVCEPLSHQGGINTTGCGEVYLYSFRSRTITCVSCNPSGLPPVANAEFAASNDAANKNTALPPRPVSEDGSYVFFDTTEALVPQDSNGNGDVYEWHDGVVSLISSGADSAPSFLLDSSPDGSNVFFGTHAKLVAQDTDASGDLYDARIGGGFGRVTGAGPCEGDACQSPVSPPIDQTPASLTFSGVGNLAPAQPAPAVVKAKAPKQRAKAKTKAPKRRAKGHKRSKQKRGKRSSAARRRAGHGARAPRTSGRGGR